MYIKIVCRKVSTSWNKNKNYRLLLKYKKSTKWLLVCRKKSPCI